MSRTIVDSKKVSTVSERAALVYLLLLPQHDGEGMIEADDVSLLVGCGRYAISRGWTASTLAEARSELVSAGLWTITEGPHGEAAEFVGWEDHQRLDKIGRGSRHLSEGETTPGNSGETPGNSGETPGNSGETPAQLRETLAKLRPRREGEGEGEEEGGRGSTPDTPQSSRDDKQIDAEASRIRRAVASIAPDGWYPNGSEGQLIREYAIHGTCLRWEDLDAYLLELSHDIAAKRGRAPDPEYLLRKVGTDWKPTNGKHTLRPIPQRRDGDPFGYDPVTGRPYHPGA